MTNQAAHPNAYTAANASTHPMRADLETQHTYFSSAAGLVITRERAAKECQKHGISAFEMFADLGDHPTYVASAVLEWLGY